MSMPGKQGTAKDNYSYYFVVGVYFIFQFQVLMERSDIGSMYFKASFKDKGPFSIITPDENYIVKAGSQISGFGKCYYVGLLIFSI